VFSGSSRRRGQDVHSRYFAGFLGFLALVTMPGRTGRHLRTSFNNVHLAALQSAKRSVHLVKKLDRIWLKGTNKHRPSSTSVTKQQMPFLTHELRELLAPKTMLSRALYDAESLQVVLGGSDQDRRAHSQLIQKLAAVEGLCRELGFEPEANFLASAPPE
jgi:hypothetical protein